MTLPNLLVQKRIDLQVIVISTSPDIIAITETFLDDSILASELFPQSCCHDQSRHGGGVLCHEKLHFFTLSLRFRAPRH